MRYLAFLFFLCLSLCARAAGEFCPITPAPSAVTYCEGTFPIASATVSTNLQGDDFNFLSRMLPQWLQTGGVVQAPCDAAKVSLLCDHPEIGIDQSAYDAALQGYSLSVTPDSLVVRAASPAGIFYAVQTLRQLATPAGIPCVNITDRPRFAYRGIMMDVSRHFFPVDFILQTLDAMAYFKLNRFHFHLTDAGGWRMESRSHPLLTTQSAWRTASDWKQWWIDRDRRYCLPTDSGAYGGFYTQDELRRIVAYAAERHITVVPEIEMPGHSEEVTFVYPELSCSGIPAHDGELCVGNERTFAFLEDVLTEVMQLFPSTYIHIGGDEAATAAWEHCLKCKALMEREGMSHPRELQHYLTARIENFLLAHGRKIIGWDEITEGNISQDAAVMAWRGTGAGAKAALSGRHVVMTPGQYCYLDHWQGQPSEKLHPMQEYYLPLDTVYSFNPVPQDMEGTPAENFIDGLQGNLWTEWMATPTHFSIMLWPRGEAIAEKGWTTANPSTADFRRRVSHHRQWLKSQGVPFFYPPFP